MKLYGNAASPFVQRVLMAARIKGRELALCGPPGGGMQTPEFAAISPMGRIPVLDDDGWTLAESGAILLYLEDVRDGPSLLPGGARERGLARMIESLAVGELAGMRAVIVGEVFRMRHQPELVDAGKAQVAAGLAAIERARDPAHVWAAGAAPTAADCALLPMLALMGIVDAAAGTASLVAANPGVAAYYDRAAATSLGSRTVKEMTEGFAAIAGHRRQQAAQQQQ